MDSTTEKYLAGLQQAYFSNNGAAQWEHFEKIKHSASQEAIDRLRQAYPDIPAALISLLEYVDGTYWREYAGEEIAFFMLGSDVSEYPYYLLSSKEMLDNQKQATEYYGDYIRREYEEVEIDDKITDQAEALRWLHFSDCMNNGGTSQLFIDFSPSASGEKGQIVRFLHDPDELRVIAGSFTEYLENLMVNDYDFISEDILE